METSFIGTATTVNLFDGVSNDELYEKFEMRDRTEGIGMVGDGMEWVKRNTFRLYEMYRGWMTRERIREYFDNEVRWRVGWGRPAVTWEKRVKGYRV